MFAQRIKRRHQGYGEIGANGMFILSVRDVDGQNLYQMQLLPISTLKAFPLAILST